MVKNKPPNSASFLSDDKWCELFNEKNALKTDVFAKEYIFANKKIRKELKLPEKKRRRVLY